MPAYTIQPVDFYFDFFASNITVGEVVRTGQNANFGWRSHNQTGTSAFHLDNETYGEVMGYEIYGPYTNGYREKLKYVRLAIDGHEHDNMSFNEMMNPGFHAQAPDPLGAAGLRLPGSPACINVGMPMLLGGAPWEATPKIGPMEDLEVVVGVPRAAEGGTATIDQPMWIRVWLAQVKGEKKLLELLKYHNHLDARGSVECSFDVGDLETTDEIPITTISKQVPSDGPFTGDDWTRLLGGNDCDKPNIENYITWSQNQVASTVNEWYQLTQSGNRVAEKYNEMFFEGSKETLYKFDRIGVFSHTHLKYLRLYRSGRMTEQIYNVQPGLNDLPMPVGRYCVDYNHAGMLKLAKPMWIINETGSIELKDNGTSIDAWNLAEGTAANRQGFLVGLMGKKIQLRHGEL